MICPFCGSEATKVVDSRKETAGRVRKRRCTECGQPFSTIERITAEGFIVRKRDGRLEPFSRTKLIRGITRAAHLYALSPPDVNAFVDRVIQMLQPGVPGLAISSTEIGRLVLQELQDSRMVTDVARIRYALVFLGQAARSSGYRGLQDFLHWLEEIYGPPNVEPAPRTPWCVVKRDGRLEPFQLSKLERSVQIVSKGRGNAREVSRRSARIISEVERELQGQALVSTQQIATEVVKLLLKSDPMAYLRYASVMKRYSSIDDFWTEALSLDRNRNRRS
ncbi:MAG: ATP cone domain-containing protein [Pseudonocardiaceae bacterium]